MYGIARLINNEIEEWLRYASNTQRTYTDEPESARMYENPEQLPAMIEGEYMVQFVFEGEWVQHVLRGDDVLKKTTAPTQAV